MPGLESSNINTAAEDQMYNKMMLSLLNIVLTPVRAHACTHTSVSTQSHTQARTTIDVLANTESDRIFTESSGSSVMVAVKSITVTVEEKEKQEQVLGLWNLVHGPLDVTYVQKDLWKNLFNWRAFTFKHRSKVLV